jgi:hypothetical protein
VTERRRRPVHGQLPWRSAVRIVSTGSAASIGVEVLLVALVAAAVVFFVGLVVKRPSDGFMFFSRAAFDAYVDVPFVASVHGPGIATVFPSLPVVPAPKDGGTYASTPLLQTVEVVVVDDVSRYAHDVLGADLIPNGEAPLADGMVGALIDEDTALQLSVGPGDAIALNALVLGGDRVATATVISVTTPYVRPNPDHASGLVVFPAQQLDDGFVSDVAALLIPQAQPVSRRFGADPADPKATVRAEAAASFFLSFFALDRVAALLGIAGFGAALWVAVAGRLIGRAVRRAAPAAAVLVALGEHPQRAARATVATPLAALLFGQVIGVVVVASTVFPAVLRLTLQPASLVPILVVLFALSAALIALANRVVGESLGPSNLVRALSEEVDG